MVNRNADMIEVLLSTYNGEAFLTEQIDSLLAQEGVELRVLARDDGSSDGTVELLEKYARNNPGRVNILRSPGRLGGPGSFGWLLGQANAPYIAFCDQDDVWSSCKLKKLLERMLALEDRLGRDVPLLVHSDLVVVDRSLQPVHASFWSYSGVDPARQELQHILVKNTVTGCAVLFNRALVEMSHPIPEEAAMHDHWIALVAAAFGRIEAVSEPLISYRQHGSNAVGAQAHDWRRVFRWLLSSCGRKSITRLRRQAAVFHARFENQLSSAQRTLVRGFISLPERGWFRRRVFLFRHDILLPGLVRNLALLFCVRLGK